MKLDRITPRFVTSFPRELEPGVLYVSATFSTTAHACACGCGREVIAPLSPAQWVLAFDGSVSLRPLHRQLEAPVQIPYLTAVEVRRNRESDDRALEALRPSTKRPWLRRLADLVRQRPPASRTESLIASISTTPLCTSAL